MAKVENRNPCTVVTTTETKSFGPPSPPAIYIALPSDCCKTKEQLEKELKWAILC